jgi:cation diffusion facilitator family transporter
MKAVTSVITGSISIRADAVHSVIDLIGVVIGYLGIRISGRPPDKRHSYGHSKAEDISGFVISILIFVAAGVITYEGVKRLIVGEVLELITLGIYVTAAAIVINVIASLYALRVARSTDSIALEATGRHMLADVWSSVAVLVGLILVRLTGLIVLDPIVALLVAILIARSGYIAMRKSLGGLMDTKLPDDEEEAITSCIMEHSSQLVGFHKLRTRKAGNQRYIDLHLVMARDASVDEAHKVCDHLEQDIGRMLKPANVTIHIEPCNLQCKYCSVSCNYRNND